MLLLWLAKDNFSNYWIYYNGLICKWQRSNSVTLLSLPTAMRWRCSATKIAVNEVVQEHSRTFINQPLFFIPQRQPFHFLQTCFFFCFPVLIFSLFCPSKFPVLFWKYSFWSNDLFFFEYLLVSLLGKLMLWLVGRWRHQVQK